MTSFATELATPTFTDGRTDTLPRLIYKDDARHTGIGDFYRLQPVLRVSFRSLGLTLLVGGQGRASDPVTNSCHLSPKDSLPEQVVE